MGAAYISQGRWNTLIPAQRHIVTVAVTNNMLLVGLFPMGRCRHVAGSLVQNDNSCAWKPPLLAGMPGCLTCEFTASGEWVSAR